MSSDRASRPPACARRLFVLPAAAAAMLQAAVSRGDDAPPPRAGKSPLDPPTQGIRPCGGGTGSRTAR
eukprot:gene14118-14361_t